MCIFFVQAKPIDFHGVAPVLPAGDGSHHTDSFEVFSPVKSHPTRSSELKCWGHCLSWVSCGCSVEQPDLVSILLLRRPISHQGNGIWHTLCPLVGPICTAIWWDRALLVTMCMGPGETLRRKIALRFNTPIWEEICGTQAEKLQSL